ncbi:hypothetical protein P280DRAFT_529039 [Massarina eburnea CBS 473.64]|uniref:F-box domain-containing protein n=1 Tax=Massarina eburnea CBS 473.64 TaxID=1395130 RepID=A0A6A6RVG5_9PLEO|nr:hypothetical protein P280DRAFT_529039 [Massarina eburnea CBS 473.64]
MAEIQIPKLIRRGYSRKADPTKVSLLLDLPPELRNCVYAHLLERKMGRLIIVRRVPSLRAELVQKMAVALLRSCRQIYHEASSAMMANNKFRLIIEYEHSLCIDDLNAVSVFLDNLGSQCQFLKKIDLFIESICPFNCPKASNSNLADLYPNDLAIRGAVHLTSFLKTLWFSPLVPSIQVFANIKLRNYHSSESVFDLDAVKIMWAKIGHEEFIKSRLSLISDIFAKRDGKSGCMVLTWPEGRKHSRNWITSFQFDENDKLTFNPVPIEVYPHRQRTDGSDAPLELHAIDWAVRRNMDTELYYRSHHLRITLESTTRRTTFQKFEALHKWLRTYRWAAMHMKITLILHFEKSGADGLANVSFSVLDLLLVLSHVKASNVAIQVSFEHKVNETVRSETYDLSLKEVRLRCLFALIRIAPLCHRHSPLPALWMNGLGDITGPFVYGSKSTIVFASNEHWKRDLRNVMAKDSQATHIEYDAGGRIMRSNVDDQRGSKNQLEVYLEYLKMVVRYPLEPEICAENL